MVCLDDAVEIVGLGRERFDADGLLRRAAKNVIAELGETVKRLPSQFTDARPDTSWSSIAGMRDRTIHGYQHVDWDILWSTLRNDLPGLRAALERDLPGVQDGGR